MRGTIRSLLDSENLRFIQFAHPGHFYSPIPDIKTLRTEWDAPTDRALVAIPGVEIFGAAQVELAQEFSEYYQELSFPEHPEEGHRYYLDNSYFSYGDAIILYSMMRRFRPSRVIEIGSGFSSAAMLDVSDKFFSGRIEFTFIDPYPGRLLTLLHDQDSSRCNIVPMLVQEAPEKIFDDLRENDVLFIDSSHVLKRHSDLGHLLFNILPALNNGVIVHFHDVLWPFEYPNIWLDQGRAWNEAYAIRAFLQFNSAFQIIYFNSMMEIQHGDFMRSVMPMAMKTPSSLATPGNSSLWLRKIA